MKPEPIEYPLGGETRHVHDKDGNLRENADCRMARLQFRFGQAHHGWLPVVIVTAGEKHAFCASSVPSDFLGDLASALDAFLGIGEGVAILHEEPRALRWSLVERGTEGELCLRAYHNWFAALHDSGQGSDVVRVTASARDLALALWRGLRALEGDRVMLLAPEHWPHPFPSRLVAQAAARLER